MAKPSGDIVVANETYATELDGESVIVHAGKTRVRKNHPLVKANPDRFDPIDLEVDFEQATAAPGEKRGQQ